ncbi:MAG: anaerobic sulfatase maturase [Planctomycetes bacterium]|nr:anaerobic sulfatase maturase [Planctomycetota bacterium]
MTREARESTGKTPHTAPSSLGVLVKPASADCNLRCQYCFYHRTSDPYLGHKRRRMSDEVLTELVKQVMASGAPASFSWQGGEPLLMGLDFYKRVTELQMKFGRNGQIVGNALQTNGLLLNDAWCEHLRQFNFLVGLSLDGPPELHNHYRTFRSGRGSFEHTYRAVDLMRRHQVEFNILAVVNQLTAARPQLVWDFFVHSGLVFLQFIPCVERDPETGKLTEASVSPEAYGEFLCRIFDLWFNNGEPVISVRFFDNVLMAYLGMAPETCEHKPECGQYVVVEYNGDVYPCDFFVEVEWKLGNLMQRPLHELAATPLARKFAVIKRGPYAECAGCQWNFICANGCPRLRYAPRGHFEDPHHFCSAYKRFYEYSAERLGVLRDKLRARQSAGSVAHGQAAPA